MLKQRMFVFLLVSLLVPGAASEADETRDAHWHGACVVNPL